MNPFLTGPIAPERNPPITPQYYQPRVYVIEDLTYGIETLVTTVDDHDYVVGQEIRLLIPFRYGAEQLNSQTGFVISVPQSDQVLVTINSMTANAFNTMRVFFP